MKVAIIGGTLAAYVCANKLSENNPKLSIVLFDESAESGLMGERPGIFKDWPILPESWASLPSRLNPTDESNAIHHSWLCKALATNLSRNHCSILLKSKIIEIKEQQITFESGGKLRDGSLDFNQVIDLRSPKAEQTWYGAIVFDSELTNNRGNRSDGSIEIWSKSPLGNMAAIQQMEWNGNDPNAHLEEEISRGLEAAKRILQTIP